MSYADFPKKNFIYKTRLDGKNKVTRHDSAILIPKDRPQPVAVDGIGQKIAENYWSKSEDRWIVRLSGPLPARPATAVVTYKGGEKESFNIKSLAARTEYAPGPWKGAQSPSPAPTPTPVKPPVVAPAVQSIILPPEYAAKVGLVAVLSGRKMHQCARDPANPARWTHAGKKASHYGLRWNVRPGGSVETYNAGVLGLWSVTDGKRFMTLAEILALLGAGPVEPPPVVVQPPSPAPVKPPAPTPPAPEPLHSRTANTLTLRADFAACVRKVDALANVVEPGNPNPIFITATRSGNTWTIPKALGSYPKGNRPNTWRISLNGAPPAGVTYHTSIMQTFLREGDANTYPPTTRE